MKNVVFLGPPGSGKGTHAEKVSRRLGIPRLSTGDMLRRHMADGTALGRKARCYVDAGLLVPDELVIAMIRERLLEPDCVRGVIFDGFPRTLAQAEALDGIASIALALSLAISDEAIVERMKGRRVCEACGHTSHTSWLGDLSACPRCGGKLVMRHDDAPATVLARLAVYHEQTKPLIGYYAGRGLLRTVASEGPVEDVEARVLEALS